MNLDVRMPIGLMFTIFGLILSVYGATVNQVVADRHSLGFNINLVWGIVQLVFGLGMLALALRARRKS